MRVLLNTSVLAACAASLAAQAPTPTFRTGTTLIELSVVALDNKGNPVTDLTKEELVLSDGGRTREIAFFRFDGGPAAAPTTAPEPLPSGFVTNRPEFLSSPQRNVTAIALDLLNTALPQQTSARAQALRYLQNLPPNTHAGLFRFSEQEPMATLQSFTDRIDLLRLGIEKLSVAARRELVRPGFKGSPIVGGGCGQPESASAPTQAAGVSRGGGKAEALSAMTAAEARSLSAMNEQLRNARLARTLASLEALGNHLSGIPGRKSLVWITSGMPILLSPMADGQTLVSYEPQIRQSAQRLANQGIAVYPVDAKGGCRALDTDKNQGLYGLNDAPQYVFGSLQVAADVTGGRFVKYDNDPTHGVTLAANDQRGTYTLGFYAADEAAASGDTWHRVKVEVKRRGIALRHREGYLALRGAQPQSLDAERWNALAYQPLDSTAIRLNARSEVTGNQVTLSLQIAAGDLYFHEKAGQVVADLEIGLVEKAAGGPTNVRQQPMEISLKDPLKNQQSALIPVKTTWPLNPATSAVRVIVRDRFTGRYGTLEMPVRRTP